MITKDDRNRARQRRHLRVRKKLFGYVCTSAFERISLQQDTSMRRLSMMLPV